MAFFVRKIARAKWPDENCAIDNLCGDAIGDLKTTKNTLSLWRVNSIDELDNAVLALAASSKSSKVETISIVWLSEDELLEKAIKIDDTIPGDTVIFDLEKTHSDLCEITYHSLGEVSKCIMNGIKNNQYRRYTRTAVKSVLVKAYKDNRICEEKCTEELLSEIKKAANQ